jgi:hypothetical protein
MKKFFVAFSLLALTCWGILPVDAASTLVPISDYEDDQHQVMVDVQAFNDYHDEMARFYSNTTDLRHDIWDKIHLFTTMLTNPETTKAEALSIQQEIQIMNNELQSKELSFRWDLNSQFPELATDKYRGCLGSATGSRGPGR